MGYLIVLGGTPFGDVSGPILLINIAIGAVAVGLYLVQVAPRADRTDQLALAAYLAFLAACLFSQFPRQSFDTALSGLGLLAVFSLARRSPLLAPNAGGRWLLAGIGLVLGIVFFSLWVGVALRWLELAGSAPPLPDLRFPPLFYGHAHDIAVLLVLCAAATVGLAGRRGRVVRMMVLGFVSAAVLVEGSRTVWLAVGAASAVVGATWVVRRGGLPKPGWFITGALVIGAVVLVALVGSGMAARLTDSETLASRLGLWAASVQAWLLDPLTGLGPGSFPWDLQLTQYFDTPSFAPRHPDNAVVQTLTEAGLVGLIGLGLGLGAVWTGRRRPLDLTAVWALAFFGVACLLTNPSDHGFLALLAVLWAATLTRRGRALDPAREPGRSKRPLRAAIVLSGSVVTAVALTWGGMGWVHDVTDPTDMVGMLRSAVSLDPGQALYHRELGANLLAARDPEATAELERALRLNPSDTAGWRLLSLSRGAAGDLPGAERAAAEAVKRERIEPSNLLSLAAATAATGDTGSARDLVGEAIARAPWLMGDLAGPDVVPGVTTTQGIEAAIDLWLSRTDDSPNIIQPAWLTGLSARDDLLPLTVVAAGKLDGTASALHAYLSCHTTEAFAALRGASDEDGTAWYWTTRYLIESGEAEPSPTTITLGSLMSGPVYAAEHFGELPSSLDNGLADLWGYGRRPLRLPPITGAPASIEAGLVLWLRDPLGVARRVVPASQLAACSALAVR